MNPFPLPGRRPPPVLRTETEFEGVLREFTYRSEDGAFSVARLDVEGEDTPIVLVGAMLGLEPGERVRVNGRWSLHPRFGPRFEVESFVPALPSGLSALEHYLGSGLVKGIGPRMARRIIERFGEDTPMILAEAPERLREVKGFSRKKAEAVAEAWERHRQVHDLMIFLQGIGLSPRLAARLYKAYGPKTAQVLRGDPYKVAMEVRRIGFRTADRIAEKIGIGREDPRRIEAGALHALTVAAKDGHTWLPREDLIRAAAALLGADARPVEEAVGRLRGARLIAEERMPEGEDAEFLPSLHLCESAVARALRRLMETPKVWPELSPEPALAAFEKSRGIELAPEQREAALAACRGGALVVTGGPGTGKTTLVRAILAALGAADLKILLCAPTGRAAQRLAEATGQRASTIHRLLKYTPGQGFFHTPHNPLDVNLLIVDETSMVDIPLAYHLLRAVPPGASVVFVGDMDQLPSVGPGNFLRDLIESGEIPVVRLLHIFRQSRRSLIITNAHRINHGEFPILPEENNGQAKAGGGPGAPDFFFIEREDPRECVEVIKRLAAERIPRRFGFDPVTDVQVLTPMRKGLLGVENLNRELQALLNPRPDALTRGGVAYRVGDKVMQIVNDYDLDVFNGDVGVIQSVDREAGELFVNYNGRVVLYGLDQLEEITPAYACTIHKSQGSEYRAVIVALHTQHYILLKRNLLYTAVTRGKRLVCLVGSRRALALALRQTETHSRFSALRQWLQAGAPPPREGEADLFDPDFLDFAEEYDDSGG